MKMGRMCLKGHTQEHTTVATLADAVQTQMSECVVFESQPLKSSATATGPTEFKQTTEQSAVSVLEKQAGEVICDRHRASIVAGDNTARSVRGLPSFAGVDAHKRVHSK